MNAEEKRIKMAGTLTQKENAFQRGMSMSFLPIRRGKRRFPRTPINIGIIEKKIITNA